MENGPFEDVFPIENGELFQLAMLVVFFGLRSFLEVKSSSSIRVLVGCKAIATTMLSKIWRTSCFCDFVCSPQIFPSKKRIKLDLHQYLHIDQVAGAFHEF